MKAKANVATISVRRVVIYHEGVNMCQYKEGKGSFVPMVIIPFAVLLYRTTYKEIFLINGDYFITVQVSSNSISKKAIQANIELWTRPRDASRDGFSRK